MSMSSSFFSPENTTLPASHLIYLSYFEKSAPFLSEIWCRVLCAFHLSSHWAKMDILPKGYPTKDNVLLPGCPWQGNVKHSESEH